MNIRDLQDKILAEEMLFSLIKKNDMENLRILIQEVKPTPNINVKSPDSEKETPLLFATRMGNAEAIRLLVEAKADMEARNSRGKNINELAADYAYSPTYLSVIKTLVEYKVDVNAKLAGGNISLHLAAPYNDSVVKFLLEAKADPKTVNDQGIQPLHLAMAQGCKDLLKPVTLPAVTEPPKIPEISIQKPKKRWINSIFESKEPKSNKEVGDKTYLLLSS